MNEPLISVIVPIYKVEQYLDRCVQSIVDQTYKNLEIILVDDGSPDNCPEMCDVWAQKDKRIKVIHQKNAGGAAARNAGLDVATGQLITFVDSDDYISCDMYATLLSLMEEDVDIAECSYIYVSIDSYEFSNEIGRSQKYDVEKAMSLHIRDIVFKQVVWNKLYRRAILENVRFPEGKSIDDEFFTYRVIANARYLVHTDKICYAYRQQGESIMHLLNPEKRFQAVEAKMMRQEYISVYFPKLSHMSLKNLWFTCIYQGQLALQNTHDKDTERVINYLGRVLKKYPLRLSCCNLKEKVWVIIAKISFRGVCILRNKMKIGM